MKLKKQTTFVTIAGHIVKERKGKRFELVGGKVISWKTNGCHYTAELEGNLEDFFEDIPASNLLSEDDAPNYQEVVDEETGTIYGHYADEQPNKVNEVMTETQPTTEMPKDEELPADKRICIVSCKNEKLLQVLNYHAKILEVEIVRMTDEAVDDLVERRKLIEEGASKEIQEKLEDQQKFKQFINSRINRNNASKQASQLFDILLKTLKKMHKGISEKELFETAQEMVWTKTEIVKSTTLSHKTCGELLNMLFLFGFIEYTKGNYEFMFRLNPALRHENIEKSIAAQIALLNHDIKRYNASIDADGSLKPDEKIAAKNLIEKLIDEKIEF